MTSGVSDDFIKNIIIIPGKNGVGEGVTIMDHWFYPETAYSVCCVLIIASTSRVKIYVIIARMGWCMKHSIQQK